MSSHIAATGQISAAWPARRVIGLSVAAEPPYARAMREAGALGLLDKAVSGDKLVTAFRQLVTTPLLSTNTLAGTV